MRGDHVLANRAAWDDKAAQYERAGRRNWSATEISWGIFDVPEEQVGMLPDVAGKDVVELGCGTAYVSAWVARLGGRPVGIDNSPRQLANALRFQEEFGVRFPLVHGDAERLPFADQSFDVAVSEYGASIWCDPYRWVPEAARVLRPGGELSFLVSGTLLILTVPERDDEGPADERLRRPYFGLHRVEWPDEDGVEFHIGYGDWIRVLVANGFEVLDLVEVQAPADAQTGYPFVNAAWASQWPSEQVWRARKKP